MKLTTMTQVTVDGVIYRPTGRPQYPPATAG